MSSNTHQLFQSRVITTTIVHLHILSGSHRLNTLKMPPSEGVLPNENKNSGEKTKLSEVKSKMMMKI